MTLVKLLVFLLIASAITVGVYGAFTDALVFGKPILFAFCVVAPIVAFGPQFKSAFDVMQRLLRRWSKLTTAF